jgi:ribulose-5-phosphate 4-epimerase/fuculose-1-phosphate aldolase
MGVAAQKAGLLPVTQHAAFLLHDIGYHDSEGVAVDPEECERIVANLGDKHILILRNHGLLTAGRTTVEALQLMLDLETACRGQLAAMVGGSAQLRSQKTDMKDWRGTGQLCFGLQIAYRRASETSAQLVKYQEDTLFHYAVFCDNYGRRGADLTI